MVGVYDVQQVCLNGHQITHYYKQSPENRKKYCDKCGKKTIHTCPNCNAEIRGKRHVSGVVAVYEVPVPEFCHNCGEPYPWTKKKKETKRISRSKEVKAEFVDFWSMIHESIIKKSKKRFEDGHYADAVESAFKEINNRVKRIVKNKTGDELDGTKLMFKAFSLDNPIVPLNNLSSQTKKDIQQGYGYLFAGGMLGIRNPKAHDDIIISRETGIHFLFLASHLMFRLDESGY